MSMSGQSPHAVERTSAVLEREYQMDARHRFCRIGRPSDALQRYAAQLSLPTKLTEIAAAFSLSLSRTSTQKLHPQRQSGTQGVAPYLKYGNNNEAAISKPGIAFSRPGCRVYVAPH